MYIQRFVPTMPKFSSIYTSDFANFISCIRRKLKNKQKARTYTIDMERYTIYINKLQI